MFLLKRTGLYEVASQLHFGVYADSFGSLDEFMDKVKFLDSDKKIKVYVHPENDNEKPTLLKLQEVCKENPGAYILYYHSKGVSVDPHLRPEEYRKRTAWRHCMEYFCLERWPKCVGLLENHDCVGILYASWSNHLVPFYLQFFSGNFWWAKSDHINKTESMTERDNWMGCETMVTSAPHTYCTLYNPIPPATTVHDFFFDPKEYRNI